MDDSKREKAERINERLSKGEVSINQTRKKFGLGNVTGGDIITTVQPDSNKEPD